jgi:esterase
MELNYQSYGKGQPLIILHGLFGMLDNWHTVSAMLASHLHVFAVDQRNHGRSPHSPEFNYEVLSDDVRDFVRQRALQRCFLAGHSMGGKTAMWTALKYPDLIDRLIIVDIAPRAYPPLHDTILKTLESLDLGRYSSRREIDDALSANIHQLPVRQFLMKNLARNDDGSFRWKMNLQALGTHYSEIMKGVETEAVYQKPTLFIRSTQSTYILESDLPAIHRLFPVASVVDFETGHWVHAEMPERLTKTMTEFLLSA